MEYTELTFKEKVEGHTWEAEMDQLVSSTFGTRVATLLFTGQEARLEYHLTYHLIAGNLNHENMTIMVETQNCPPEI